MISSFIELQIIPLQEEVPQRPVQSSLPQEGVRPGQRLLSVSDPIRTNEDWEVGPNTSLSRVRDAIQFRRPTTINFLLSHASVEDDAGWSLENAQR